MAASSENVLSALIPLYFDDDSKVEFTPTVLSFIDDHQLFALTKPSSLQPIVSYIHNCLNSSNKRLEGLILLEKLVEQASTLVFVEHVETWIKLLLQILKIPGENTFHQKSCTILSLILTAATDFADISRYISSSVVGPLLTVLLQAPDVYYKEAVCCIKVCAECYPGATGTFRSKIERLVLTDLQGPCPSPHSSSCLSLIAGCGPGGKNHVRHSEGWSTQFNKIYSTLKHTVSSLYQVLDTVDSKTETNSDMFQLEDLPSSTAARQDVLLHRLKVFSHVLSTLLRQPFKFAVKVPVEQILEIICDCLAVNGKMLLSRASTDHLLLLVLLPAIHVQAFCMLDSLVVCCRQILLPFTSSINKLFVQTLVWSRTLAKYGHQKQYSELREKVYDSMLTWLKVLGTSTNLVSEETDLTKEIISDVTPLVDVLKLSSGGLRTSTEPPKKKKKNQGYQDITHSMSTYRKVDHQANSSLTSTCLKAFQHFIFNFGSSLQSKTYKNVQECIMTVLLEVHRSGNEPPIPYKEDNSRLGLYEVLKACVISPHSKLPSLLQCAVRLFSIGQNDPSVEVSSFCRDAMLVCDCLIHPRVPCLRGPNIEKSEINVSVGSTDSCVDPTVGGMPTVGGKPTVPTVAINLPDRTSCLSRSTVYRTSLSPQDEEEEEMKDAEGMSDDLSDNSESEEMVATVAKETGIDTGVMECDEEGTSVVKQTGITEFVDDEDDDDDETLPEKDVVIDTVILREKSLLKETAKVVEEKVVITEEESQDGTIKTIEKTRVSLDLNQSKAVDSMVMAFVDEGPDSD